MHKSKIAHVYLSTREKNMHDDKTNIRGILPNPIRFDGKNSS
jgi:hypothetical protein